MPFQSNSPFQVESPGAMRGRNTQQNFMKGIAKAIEDYSNIEAERTKIKGQVMVNELKAKQNFFYKIQEQMAERENKLRFIKEAQAQFGQGGGMGGEGGVATDVNAPQMRLGAGGEPTLHYESPAEKEKRIQNGYKQIETQRLAGRPLTPAMERFLEKYPEKVWRKEETDRNKITPSQALNIISDPFKSQQLKKYYPDLYKRVESIAKQENEQDAGDILVDRNGPPIEEQTSPYPEYPDAFQENGVWKVMQNGKKYRIE